VKRALLALAVCALLAVPARADRDYLTYKVRAGDSLALLAAEYYGDRNHAVFIMVANKLDHRGRSSRARSCASRCRAR
jgi:hypothetical protein